MTTFPRSPRLLKGGIVLIDPEVGTVKRVIALQYNPDTLSRTLQVRGAGPESGDHLEALRLTGPPVETIKIDAELDAADQLEFPDQNRTAVDFGIHPQLAALEMLVYPSTNELLSANRLAQMGTLEILPARSDLPLFVWSRQRVLPVRITDLSVVEEAFDPALNPLRAKVSLGMRVLSVNDLGFNQRGSQLFLGYHLQKERFAALALGGALGALGLSGLP